MEDQTPPALPPSPTLHFSAASGPAYGVSRGSPSSLSAESLLLPQSRNLHTPEEVSFSLKGVWLLFELRREKLFKAGKPVTGCARQAP